MLTVSESRTDIVLTALRLPHVRLGVGLTLFAMLLQAASGSFAFTTPLVFFGGWYLGSGLLLMKQQQAAKELAERARARSDAEGSERPEEGLQVRTWRYIELAEGQLAELDGVSGE